MLNIHIAGDDIRAGYRDLLADELARRGVAADLGDHAPGDVDCIVLAPTGPLQDFAPFTRARAVLSVWAGVERLVSNPTLTIPLARMVDDSLTRRMTEYVLAHVLRHHIGMDPHIHGLRGEWRQDQPKLAPERPVTILGMGVLGQAAGMALAQIGFPVTGWSRSPRPLPFATRSLSGPEGLDAALTGAEILVLLLPRTAETENLLNAERLSLLAPGASIINAARGPIIDDDALIAALNNGHVGHATLDVFRIEPLPVDHPYWHHPRVTVTPHVAADTRPESAVIHLADNIGRLARGEPLADLVDRALGY